MYLPTHLKCSFSAKKGKQTDTQTAKALLLCHTAVNFQHVLHKALIRLIKAQKLDAITVYKLPLLVGHHHFQPFLFETTLQ